MKNKRLIISLVILILLSSAVYLYSNDFGSSFGIVSPWKKSSTNVSTAVSTDNIGIGEDAPETDIEITSTAPYITLHNSTHEKIDGGMESRICFKGEDPNGVEWHLATIQVSHDGTSADGKGDLIFQTNDGNDADDTLQERMRIDSSGNVGIGTTSPGVKLHINAHGGATLDSGTASSVVIETDGQMIARFISSDSSYAGFQVRATDAASSPYLQLQNITNVDIWTLLLDTSDNFHLINGSATGTAIATFLDGGNVGIGTIYPATRLHTISSTAGTNTLQPVATFECTTTGVPLAGFGTKVNLKAETDPNSAGNSKILAFYGAAIEDPTTDSEDGAFVVGTMLGGAAATEKWRVSSDGTIKIIANNGSSINEGYLTEEVTIPVGSGADPVVESTSNLAPASSLILGCVFYVTDAPGGGAATIDIGITGSGDLDDLIDGASCDILGESGDNFTNGDADHLGIVRNTAAATLTLTTDGDVTDDEMKVRIIIFYRDLTVPTS